MYWKTNYVSSEGFLKVFTVTEFFIVWAFAGKENWSGNELVWLLVKGWTAWLPLAGWEASFQGVPMRIISFHLFWSILAMMKHKGMRKWVLRQNKWERLWPEESIATQWGDSGAWCILEELLSRCFLPHAVVLPNINSKELLFARCKLNRKPACETEVNFPSWILQISWIVFFWFKKHVQRKCSAGGVFASSLQFFFKQRISSS